MRAVVVGLGVMGRNHLRTLRALRIETTTVDPDPQAGADHLELGILADIACIATPPEYLFPSASQALDLGMDVLVEKPMAVDLDFARMLADKAKAAGRQLRVGYVERYNPAVVALRERLFLVGAVRHVSARRLGLPPRRHTLSPALDLATHDLDVLRYLGFTPTVEHAAQRDGHLVATLRLSEQATASLEASHLHPVKVRTLDVVGSDGMLRCDYQAQRLDFFHEGGSYAVPVPRAEPLRQQWVDFLQGGGTSAADGTAALALAEDIERWSNADATMPSMRDPDGRELLPASSQARSQGTKVERREMAAHSSTGARS